MRDNKKVVSEIVTRPGLESFYTPQRLKYMQDTFGEHFVIAKKSGTGVVHELTINQELTRRPHLASSKIQGGGSITKNGNSLEFLNRTAKNKFPTNDLALACFMFKPLHEASLESIEHSLEEHIKRSIPSFLTHKLTELIEKLTKMKCYLGDCYNIQYEKAWDEIRKIKSGTKRNEIITSKIIDNIFIAAASKPKNDKNTKKNHSGWEGELSRLLKVAKKYKLEIDLERIPEKLQWDGEGSTVLIVAAMRGYIRNVELLLNAGANINAKNTTGHTALYYAVLYGHEEVANTLFRNKKLDLLADPDVLYAAIRSRNLNIVNTLIANNIPINNPIKLLKAAFESSDVSMLDKVIKYFAENRVDIKNPIEIFWIIRKSRNFILQDKVIGYIEILAKAEGKSPLTYILGNPECYVDNASFLGMIDLLLQRGADPCLEDKNGISPLACAIKYSIKHRLNDTIDLMLENLKIKPLEMVTAKKDFDLLIALLNPYAYRCSSTIKEIYLKNLDENKTIHSAFLILSSKFTDVKNLNDFIINIIEFGFTTQMEQQLEQMGFSEQERKTIQKGTAGLNNQFMNVMRKKIEKAIETERTNFFDLKISEKVLLQEEAQVNLIQNMQDVFLNILIAADKRKSKWLPELREGYSAMLIAPTGEAMLDVIQKTTQAIREKEGFYKGSTSARDLEILLKQVAKEKDAKKIDFSKKYQGFGAVYTNSLELRIKLSENIKKIDAVEEEMIKYGQLNVKEKDIIHSELMIAVKSRLTKLKSDVNQAIKNIDMMRARVEKARQTHEDGDVKQSLESHSIFSQLPKTKTSISESQPKSGTQSRRD